MNNGLTHYVAIGKKSNDTTKLNRDMMTNREVMVKYGDVFWF